MGLYVYFLKKKSLQFPVRFLGNRSLYFAFYHARVSYVNFKLVELIADRADRGLPLGT